MPSDSVRLCAFACLSHPIVEAIDDLYWSLVISFLSSREGRRFRRYLTRLAVDFLSSIFSGKWRYPKKSIPCEIGNTSHLPHCISRRSDRNSVEASAISWR